jgi:hypothetical protein
MNSPTKCPLVSVGDTMIHQKRNPYNPDGVEWTLFLLLTNVKTQKKHIESI